MGWEEIGRAGQTELFQQNVEAQPPDIFMQAGLTDPVCLSRNAKALSPVKKNEENEKKERKMKRGNITLQNS